MWRAGFYFAFTWRASPSRRVRYVGANNSNPMFRPDGEEDKPA